MPKRYRSRSRSVDFSRAVKTARRTGTLSTVSKARRARAYYKLRPTTVAQRVDTLYKMIETKENCLRTSANVALAHNQVNVVKDSNDAVLNIFYTTQSTGDPMQANQGNRIGDQITVKGCMIKGFFENALSRPKVFYRVMLLKGSKGETFTRATIFKGDADNKMIDQVNTERFTIVAQKTFTISATNYNASTVSASGVPYSAPNIAGDYPSGIASKTFKMWVPGTKFGRNGNVIYENGSTSQLKFYDYRIVIVVYDWYGTPQDVNNVGKINELYTKMYFKDA